jgi:hypothetical protein
MNEKFKVTDLFRMLPTAPQARCEEKDFARAARPGTD